MGTPRPPGPRGLDLLRQGVAGAGFLPGLFQRVAGEHGDLARIGVGPLGLYLVSGPDLIQQVLVDQERSFEKGKGERRFARRLLGRGVLGSEGAFHDRQHAALVPSTHGGVLDRYAATVVEHAERLQRRWSPGRPVDAFDELGETTLRGMVQILFGDPPGTPAGSEMTEALSGAVEALESLPAPVLPGADRLPLPANRRFEEAKERLDALVARHVVDRRATGRTDDLLGALAAATLPDGSEMPAEQVRDEALSIFRGHKTTGTLVSWCWWLMARHPEAEAEVLDEIDAVVGGRLPEAADVPKLEKTRRLIDESMRLFPPAPLVARRAEVDVELDGYPIPRGSSVVVSQWVVHRDPRWHPEPRRFDPERFLPERRAGWHPFVYFPFGGGMKTCLGDEVAPFEALLILATVGRRWRLPLDPEATVVPKPLPTLQPKGLRVLPVRR
jgi:cytochrome P450